eukprot:TRINITY_DN1650_c0_g1_i5.p2 TRINITY_DN1650_c0_g1~~TRINITY_DN1650_c0_g1_i5.p2  ORF type:complete len:223 (+),score=59.44 TRINITY_DN1650_c0_g1_i5:432-1100(+)
MYVQCTGKSGLIYFFKDDLELDVFVTTKEDKKKKKNKEPLVLKQDADLKEKIASTKHYVLTKDDIISLYGPDPEQDISAVDASVQIENLTPNYKQELEQLSEMKKSINWQEEAQNYTDSKNNNQEQSTLLWEEQVEEDSAEDLEFKPVKKDLYQEKKVDNLEETLYPSNKNNLNSTPSKSQVKDNRQLPALPFEENNRYSKSQIKEIEQLPALPEDNRYSKS